jgi:hypothetical protein
MADGGVGEITPQLNKLVTKRAEEIYFKEKGKTKADFDKSFDKAIKEFGYEPNLYHKVMSEIGMEYEEYSNGGKMADGGIVKNIHEDLARINNRLKKLEEINSEDAYSESQMLRKQKSALEALLLNYEDEPRNTEFMYKARQHHYAEGGKLEAGVYRVGKPKRIDTNFYEQKIVEIFDNGDISTASDYARKSGDFLSQKYPIITAEQLKEQYKYAQGGELDLPKQNKYNKKVLELVNENGVDSKKEFGQLVVSAFTDANFHSEARKFVSILAKKPEWAKEPKLNYDLPLEELQKEKAKTVWGSEYYAPEDSVDNLGRKIANLGLWEFEPIVDSLIYASHMKGLHTIADALEKIKNSEEPENKWNYTDVDEIEYVVVKDKNGKELKFLGKYVLSGVHDLLEKGGKLSEMGKYYSKDNVVSVFVGGKNIIDKNTVSGVWIMKDAKPVAEDVVDMKIGKTTIKKGHNGWVGKTMVENFKGYDWDITTIKNYNGDLTTTAQGGKNEKKDGYGMFSFALYQDPNIRLKVSRPARVTDKVVTEQHEQAVKEFKERQDEIAEIVDKIQAKKKMADGGAIGFDALAKKVAKNYEGDKVKKEYQNQYGKTYDKKEAEEVGKKVAAKVYRQQQANQGKMKKGGKTSSFNRSESKMTKIARKASEIRKENEPWKDAFNRAKAMIG